MVPVGFALAWVGYAMGFWGHALIKGYDLSFGDIASPVSYYTGSWPPGQAPNTVIFPTGKGGKNTPASDEGTGASASKLNTEAGSAGRPSPGSVAGRL